MPYIPRRLPTTVGIAPEHTQPPVQSHSPIPVDQKDQKSQRQKLGLGTISPKTYEPDFERVYKTLFGKEPKIDEITGQLMHPNPDTRITVGSK